MTCVAPRTALDNSVQFEAGLRINPSVGPRAWSQVYPQLPEASASAGRLPGSLTPFPPAPRG